MIKVGSNANTNLQYTCIKMTLHRIIFLTLKRMDKVKIMQQTKIPTYYYCKEYVNIIKITIL